MRWAARALTLVLVLTGCGQLPSAHLVTTAVEPAQPAAASSPPPEQRPGDVDGERKPTRRNRSEVASAAGPSGSPSAVPAAPAVAAPPPSTRLALVVGIDDYPGTRDLRAAQADARTVSRALQRLGFPASSTRVLLGGEATAQRIVEGLRWLASGTRPGALGVFFYAGHVRKVGGDPDGDGEELDEALVGSDGGLVTDGTLAAALAPARGRMWLAYAGCYAEGFDDAEAPGRISTYASGEDSLAYESTALGHSFMVEYMIRRALPDAGAVSVEGLYRWASNQMEGREERFRPLQDDRVRDDLVIGAVAPAPAPPAASPAPGPTARPCLVVLRCRG